MAPALVGKGEGLPLSPEASKAFGVAGFTYGLTLNSCLMLAFSSTVVCMLTVGSALAGGPDMRRVCARLSAFFKLMLSALIPRSGGCNSPPCSPFIRSRVTEGSWSCGPEHLHSAAMSLP